jgi:hypothetical protein
MVVYQLVSSGKTRLLSLSELQESEKITNIYTGHGRKELQGEPVIKGFAGPMYNGQDKDGNTIIRYETAKVYATYD